jgi:uncharacterized protein (DUF302 family)
MTKKKTYIIHVCNVQHGKAVYDKLIKLGALAKFKLTDMPFPGIFS